MPPACAFFSRFRLALAAGWRHRLGIAVLVLLHLLAAAVLLYTEDDLIARLAFLFTWGLLNFLWLLLLRRPSVAASLSLVMVVVLILLSQFKQDILIMSANFVDVMLIDADTASFLLTIFRVPRRHPASRASGFRTSFLCSTSRASTSARSSASKCR